jgi:acyl-coenzyme A synthetase/AMP-(fatty) acid ligase
MPRNEPTSLWGALNAAGNSTALSLFALETERTLSDLVEGSALYGHAEELRGRTVLIVTKSQLAAALALIELDGVVRRIVLCPPDMPLGFLPYVIESAGVDAIVSDGRTAELNYRRVRFFVPCNGEITPCTSDRSVGYETEWILLTSGTTGWPKLVVHTLQSLTGAIDKRSTLPQRIVWSTFYDIRRYGGLQIFLRALFTGASLVLSNAQESTADFLGRAGSHGVTHISGTPTHWRRALMSPGASQITPEYIRLSGEIADQAILDRLHQRYPQAAISHAFASTEAGVAFEVKDGEMGFPIELLGHSHDVEMKVENHTLRVRSNRTASRYLNGDSKPLKDAEGFVDTGDVLELKAGRYYFVGRRDGTVNVGGMKVHPEEVEAVLNRHPDVSISLVKTKRSPITGALVVADVVLRTSVQPDGNDTTALQSDILQFCRGELARYRVPVALNFVPALPVAESGKLVRPLA